MKKVYIPTEEEIEKLNSVGVNTYNYLLSKVTETLIMKDVIYEDIDMFEYVYENLSEYPEILYSIARIYPDRISLSNIASKDINLLRMLTKKIKNQDTSIYNLDYITQFSEELLEEPDLIVLKNVASVLADKLISTPRYRFEYKGPNILLDNIFTCELPKNIDTTELLSYLMTIDPIYATKQDISCFYQTDKKNKTIPFELTRGMTQYNIRYGMETDIQDKNIKREKSKKLIRCLNEHKIEFKKIHQ